MRSNTGYISSDLFGQIFAANSKVLWDYDVLSNAEPLLSAHMVEAGQVCGKLGGGFDAVETSECFLTEKQDVTGLLKRD
jgi:hypothetical protein